jgi:hypothetical protein
MRADCARPYSSLLGYVRCALPREQGCLTVVDSNQLGRCCDIMQFTTPGILLYTLLLQGLLHLAQLVHTTMAWHCHITHTSHPLSGGEPGTCVSSAHPWRVGSWLSGKAIHGDMLQCYHLAIPMDLLSCSGPLCTYHAGTLTLSFTASSWQLLLPKKTRHHLHQLAGSKQLGTVWLGCPWSLPPSLMLTCQWQLTA